MQDLGYELRRIPLPGNSVNKGEIMLSALTIHREFIASDYSGHSEVQLRFLGKR
jgi:hypothetical protein